MKKTLQSLFLSKTMFFLCTVFSLFFWALWTLLVAKLRFWELVPDGVFYIALVVGLLVAYRKGETNVQKALIGGLLMLLCNSNVEMLLAHASFRDTFCVVVDAMTLILAVVVFVGHLVLQSDHVGTKNAMVVNQCGGLTAIILLIYFIRQALFVPHVDFTDLTFIPAWLLTYLLLICIETRVQEYKAVRAHHKLSGTWTDYTRGKAKEIFKL